MSNINKKILKRILKLILIIIIFLCIALTNGKNRNISFPEYVLNTLITLPQRLFNYLGKKISNNETFFADVEELKKENELLKKDINELKIKLSDYDLIAEENKKNRIAEQTYNTYKEYNVIIADVIADSANNWDEIYIINKGQDDGVKPEQVVITSEGLVGFVKNVSPKTSTIVAIIDASTSLSGRLRESGDRVIVKGSNDLKDNEMLKVVNIPVNLKLKSGDILETSGIGGIYPKGLTIGYVQNFIEKDNPLENEALVATSVNFNKLETVAIIVEDINKEVK